MGQTEQTRQNNKTPGQGCLERIARTWLPAQDHWDRNVRIRQPLQDRKERTT
jgi:hypothetical protein